MFDDGTFVLIEIVVQKRDRAAIRSVNYTVMKLFVVEKQKKRKEKSIWTLRT